MSNTQKEERGKWPIDRPCSACSAGDTKMEYHDHGLPKREEDLPTVLDHKFVANECHEHGCHFLFLQNRSNCARCNADLAHPCAGSGETRFDEFDEPNHPFNQWWGKHGQYMMSGGGRREFIWACRGWIAREQLLHGAEVTGDSLTEQSQLTRELSQARERVEELERLRLVAERAFKLQNAVSIPGRTGELNCLQISKAWLMLEKRAEVAESSLATLKAGSNYVADDEVYPTRVEFNNGRVVTIKQERDRVFLGIGMKEGG